MILEMSFHTNGMKVKKEVVRSFVRCVIFSNGHADWLSIEFNEILLFYFDKK